MLKSFICRSAKRNNGIVKIHLVKDTFTNSKSHPWDVFINAPFDELGEEFAPGDEWLVQITKIRGGK